MTGELSILDLFFQASFLVKVVMLVLLSLSVVSWAMIYRRSMVLKAAVADSQRFEDKFWSGMELLQLYKEVTVRKDRIDGTEKIFYSGFTEFNRLTVGQTFSSEAVMDGIIRSMRVTVSREVDQLETNLPFLATVGSITPYIGLFGTVWGIMHSFIALGAVKQATLAMVAPGIAEALIATAMGLFAAIPAVIAYNQLSVKVAKLEHSYASFMDEFSTILHRQTITHKED